MISSQVRIALLVWGELQDRYFTVKYTDVDYVVFSDAARFMASGSSPYLRLTYRYTPLLAALLTPNVVLGEWWGKALFAACDCAVGFMIIRMLQRHTLAMPLACAWLLNPIVVNVSTRGNAEGFVAIWAVASLYAFERRRYTAAALLLGVATHVKIYPVVYGIPMALSLIRGCQLSPSHSSSAPQFLARLRHAACFGSGKLPSPLRPLPLRPFSSAPPQWLQARLQLLLASATLFTVIPSCSRYSPAVFAQSSRWSAILTTARRTSITLDVLTCAIISRHIFFPCELPHYTHGFTQRPRSHPRTRFPSHASSSPHPATRYLDVAAASSFGKSAFLPQAAAVVVAGAALSSDVPFALFVQTLAFVALNKVYANDALICFSICRFFCHHMISHA